MSNFKQNDRSRNPLGESVEYVNQYKPSLLYGISRKEKRQELGIGAKLPFHGVDMWNAYELGWLNDKGLPQVAIGEFYIPANSLNIIESKSFKLYLNSLNQTRFKDAQSLSETLQEDLSKIVGCGLKILIRDVDCESEFGCFEGECIDHQDIEINQYDYQPSLLKLETSKAKGSENKEDIIEEKLFSHLLKSNCLITNQPDWGSVFIQYKGNKICHEALLKYLISFRSHNEFHEQCVERIFIDIQQYCQPEELTVYARYTRRGGLDINPWRSNTNKMMDNSRLVRQ